MKILIENFNKFLAEDKGVDPYRTDGLIEATIEEIGRDNENVRQFLEVLTMLITDMEQQAGEDFVPSDVIESIDKSVKIMDNTLKVLRDSKKAQGDTPPAAGDLSEDSRLVDKLDQNVFEINKKIKNVEKYLEKNKNLLKIFLQRQAEKGEESDAYNQYSESLKIISEIKNILKKFSSTIDNFTFAFKGEITKMQPGPISFDIDVPDI